MVALEIEHQLDLMRGVRRTDRRKFVLSERREQGARTAVVIDYRRHGLYLDGRENGRGDEAKYHGTVFHRPSLRCGDGDHSGAYAADQVGQGAVLAELVKHCYLEIAEPQCSSDDRTAEKQHHGPDKSIKLSAFLVLLSAEEKDADDEQEVGEYRRGTYRDDSCYVGP